MPANPDDHSGDLDVDAAFAQIVARWDEAPAREGGAGPAPHPGDGAAPATPADPERAPHPEAHGSSPAEAGPPAVVPLPPAPVEPALPPPPAPARREAAEHDPFGDEHFVPPEPPPLPRDLTTWAAWAGVLGAPALLLLAALLWQRLPGLVAAVAVAAFVAGFATLVARLPARRDDDDDDGAVV